MLKEKIFDALFFTLLLVSPIAFLVDSMEILRYIVTPGINVLFLFQVTTKRNLKKEVKILNVAALILSLVSVYSFIFINEQSFLILGLISYVLSLIIYTIIFYHSKPYDTQKAIMVSSLLLVFSLYVLNLVYENLGSLFPLTLFYIIIITLMVQTSYLRKGYVTKKTFYFGFIGSIFLMLSSTIFMIDRFHLDWLSTDVAISFFYSSGMFMVIKSIMQDKTNTITS